MYLVIVTALLPDVVGYPESGKTGVRIAFDQSPDARFLLKDSAKNAVGYWDGEEGADVAGFRREKHPRS